MKLGDLKLTKDFKVSERSLELFELFRKTEILRIELEQVEKSDLERKKFLLVKIEEINLEFRERDARRLIKSNVEKYAKCLAERSRKKEDMNQKRLNDFRMRHDEDVAMTSEVQKKSREQSQKKIEEDFNNTRSRFLTNTSVSYVESGLLDKADQEENSEKIDSSLAERIIEQQLKHFESKANEQLKSLSQKDIKLCDRKSKALWEKLDLLNLR